MTQLISKINENTSVSLKVVIPVVLSVLSCAWGISAQVNQVKREIQSLKRAGWTFQNMETWRAELKNRNQNLDVPGAKEGLILVQSSDGDLR